MSNPEVSRPHPQRWDQPFGEEMTDALVERLLKVPPFSQMSERSFPRTLPLKGLLLNDARIVNYEPDEIVIRENEYGSSAFMVLDGNLRVTLENLPPELIGASKSKASVSSRLKKAVAQLWPKKNAPETRQKKDAVTQEAAQSAKPTGIFLQDVPSILDNNRTAQIKPGELFGELSSLTRSPRTATIFAESKATLLEIRWQGLRDMMRFTPTLKEHIDQLYRQNSLRVHLRETELLANLPTEALTRVANEIEFQTFGSFDWRDATPSTEITSMYERVQQEPLIAEENQNADSLLLIRSGFARVTVGTGEGHQTLAYVGKGQTFGAEELIQGAVQGKPTEWKHSLRAVGYLDVLRLPKESFLADVLPHLTQSQIEPWLETLDKDSTTTEKNDVGGTTARRLDFLVDHRLINGTESMVIDLERCTRCDDCVRACASTHEGNPRFVRQGVVHDGLQYTQACMHCVDPVCMIGCPTGAIHRETSTGAVQINDETCIGCSTCANGCPYSNIQMVEIRDPEGAIQIDHESGQPILRATKCDLCVDQWSGPACQQACPHDALVRIDLSKPLPITQWSDR